MQSSGYSLEAPAEPEPRNVVGSAVTDHAVASAANISHATVVTENTTGATQEALESSANAASFSRDEESSGQDVQADTGGSGWQWADRAQVREFPAGQVEDLSFQAHRTFYFSSTSPSEG